MIVERLRVPRCGKWVMVNVVIVNYDWKIANSVVSSLVLVAAFFFVCATVIAPIVASCRIADIPVVAVDSKKPNLTGVIDEIVVVKQIA